MTDLKWLNLAEPDDDPDCASFRDAFPRRQRADRRDMLIILAIGWWSIIAFTIGSWVMLSWIAHGLRRLL
jgi:hypothetical protein